MKVLNKTTIITAVSTLAIGFLIGLLVFGGKESGTMAETHQHDESKIQEWTCSMHPSVRQKEPGKCPICGMDLIPVETGYGDENPMEIKMSQAAIQLASIQTSIVNKGGEFSAIRLNGKVQPNEQNVYTQTSHIAGRIEALQLSFTGEYVKKGQEIAKVYSPELVLAQKELFEAYKIRDTQPELYQAAREKLKNWKLTDKLIDQIIENENPQEQFPIFSDINGVVLSKKVNLGDYVNRGSAMFEIADLSRLWILLDVYESDLGKVQTGDEVEYAVQSLPGETFQGKIGFIDPVIDPKTRVARARISVNNSNQRLKPEMFVTAYAKGKFTSASDDIIIPKSAIMWTGKRSIVYVKNQTDAGISFEMREVTLGPAMGNRYVIEDGLSAGEEIATYGTFSIDAAAQLAGKPSMMNPEMEMTGHDHNKEEAESVNQPLIEVKSIQLDADLKNAFNPIIDNYLELKDALVDDDFGLAEKNASKLLDEMKKVKMEMFEGEAHQVWMQYGMEARQNLEKIVKAENIGEARALFKPFSQHMIQLVKIFNPFDKKLYIQHCPMADDFKGADWLSMEENIMNPYFGESMLTCGEVTGEIGVSSQAKSDPSEVKSPKTSAMANIGDNHVHIEYSSPRVRGRQIFGGLVAYDVVWSTGAHKVTNISFSKKVEIAGKTVKAGKYALFTIPGREKWTIILNKNWDQHLADEYNPQEDVLRFSVNPQTISSSKEELTFEVQPDVENAGIVRFIWDKTTFVFQFKNK